MVLVFSNHVRLSHLLRPVTDKSKKRRIKNIVESKISIIQQRIHEKEFSIK